MKALLEGLVAEAGIAQRGASEMFLAAALGTLRTGDVAKTAYRARLDELAKILIAGLTRGPGIRR